MRWPVDDNFFRLPGKMSSPRKLISEYAKVIKVWKFTGKQKIGHFFKPEPPFALLMTDKIFYIITTVIQFTVKVNFYLSSIPPYFLLVPYYLSLTGYSDEDPGAIFVSKT